MRHGFANKKLNRTSEHRKALLKNMLNSLIKYEQITTTLPKAKFLKPQADKIITLGKKETLQTTRLLMKKLQIDSTDSLIPGGRYHHRRDYMNFTRLNRPNLQYKKLNPLTIKGLSLKSSIIKAIDS